MMFVSPHLQFDPTRPLPPMVEPLCNLRMEIPAEVNLHAFGAGQFWTYPLARRGQNGLVGLRLTPGTALTDSPVVEVYGAQGLTLASSAAFLVPVSLWQRMRGGGASWNTMARLPAQTWGELIAFHHSLGGSDELEAVRKLARDTSIKAACVKGAGDYPGLAAACFEALQRVDTAAETAIYSNYVATAIRTREAPPPPEAGCWNEALTSAAYAIGVRDRRTLAWRLMRQLPGLDTDRSRFSLVAGAHQSLARKSLKAAAREALKRPEPEWTEDPVWPAVQALARTRRYDGANHFAAAIEFEKRDDFAAAFNALAASAWWDVSTHDTTRREVLDVARCLARRAGWAEIADSLDEMVEVRREAEAECRGDAPA